MFDEFEKHVENISKEVRSMLEWAKTQENEEWFTTDEGKKLLLDLGGVAKHNAFLYFDMAAIELKEGIKSMRS